MSPTPDRNADRKQSAGDAVDWQQVLVEHRRWLRTVLRARGVDVGAIDEVLQEVSAAAVGGSDRLRDPEKVSPWLYRIAVTAALQYRRRMGRQRKLVERYRDIQPSVAEHEHVDPLNWLLADEERQLVRKALSALTPRDAEIMLLKYTEGWSYRDLAKHMGLSISAVEARLHRARHRMRRALAKLSPEMVSR